jgi:transketolase|tara:strand:- start:1542 stop:2012 length:471 start_codon:yes stop_codon:yes gene_type:complete
MRKEFASFLHDEMSYNEKIVILTGDLGYGLWDKIKLDYPDRFYNVMSSEQLMVGAATGLAMEGFIPLVYSITPFVLYRPFELLRNYLNHECIPVKLVGGGRDKDYGYLGFSHWAEEDIKVLSTLENIQLFKPENPTKKLYREFLYNEQPSYLNLSR